jgi:hypothetical protein
VARCQIESEGGGEKYEDQVDRRKVKGRCNAGHTRAGSGGSGGGVVEYACGGVDGYIICDVDLGEVASLRRFLGRQWAWWPQRVGFNRERAHAGIRAEFC